MSVAGLHGTRVSVVIAAYNSERFIADALDSVFAEVSEQDDVIVVDDGSMDGTAEVVRRYPTVRLVQQRNAGPAAARNTAIRLSTATFIAAIDHDDLWPAGRLDRMVAALEANPEAGYVAGRQRLMVTPGAPLPYWLKSTEPEELERFQNERGTGMIMIRRSAFDRVGLFEESMTRGGEDIDWVFRCREAGYSEVEIDDEVLIRRLHGGNITANEDDMKRATFAILRKRAQRRRSQ
ncbi:unannotated protein [freshwater metagenome]|uniref:Unannotated protein n=1 Tax=freshwater metagenome TaxID=449393 RepID=A0A6J6VRH2_9ZZZZ